LLALRAQASRCGVDVIKIMATGGSMPHGRRGIAESVAAGVDGVEHATFLTADGVELDVHTVD
jgi:hypothetical protein